MGYRVIVKIAGIGARYIEDDGAIGHSKTGHVWLTLVNDQTGEEFNFGFHPSVEGERKTDPGLVRTDDYRYLDVAYQQSLAVSADQFNNVYNICRTALSQNTFGAYRGGWNACPDFAFKVLWQAGIGTKSLSLDGTGTVLDTLQKAAPSPAGNVSLLKGMGDYNFRFVAPGLIGSGLDARDTSNRTNVISNVVTGSSDSTDDSSNQNTQQNSQTNNGSSKNDATVSDTSIGQSDAKTEIPSFNTNLMVPQLGAGGQQSLGLLDPNILRQQLQYLFTSAPASNSKGSFTFESGFNADSDMSIVSVDIGGRIYEGEVAEE